VKGVRAVFIAYLVVIVVGVGYSVLIGLLGR
jgi:hypothetical protein